MIETLANIGYYVLAAVLAVLAVYIVARVGSYGAIKSFFQIKEEHKKTQEEANHADTD